MEDELVLLKNALSYIEHLSPLATFSLRERIGEIERYLYDDEGNKYPD